MSTAHFTCCVEGIMREESVAHSNGKSAVDIVALHDEDVAPHACRA